MPIIPPIANEIIKAGAIFLSWLAAYILGDLFGNRRGNRKGYMKGLEDGEYVGKKTAQKEEYEKGVAYGQAHPLRDEKGHFKSAR